MPISTFLGGASASGAIGGGGDVTAEVEAHRVDTTDVHGIADTAALILATDARLSDARAPTAHTHDDRYYTETEVDAALSAVVANPAQATGVDDTAYLTGRVAAAVAAGKTLRILGGPWAISELTLPSGANVDATGATFTLTGGTAKRFLVNTSLMAGSPGAVRDTGIRWVGGTFNRGAVDGRLTALDGINVMFGFVDGLDVRDVTINASAGAYGVYIYGCTQFRVENVTGNFGTAANTDIVHMAAACRRGRVAGVYGSTGDDVVAVTCRNGAPTGGSNALEVAGQIGGDCYDIDISEVRATTTRNGVKLLSARSDDSGTVWSVRDIRVSNVFASTPNSATFTQVRIGTDSNTNAVTYSGGFAEDITVEHVTAQITGATPVGVGFGTTARGFRVSDIKGLTGLGVNVFGGTIEDVLITDSRNFNTGTSFMAEVKSGATVQTMMFRNCRHRNSVATEGGFLSTVSGATVNRVFYLHCYSDKAERGMGRFATTTELFIDGYKYEGATNTNKYLNTITGAVVTVRTASMHSSNATADDITVTAGTVTSFADGFRCDMSKLQRVSGGRCTNTNTGLTPVTGTMIGGPWVCDGTTWKSLINAATF